MVSGLEFSCSNQETELTTLLNVEEPRAKVPESVPASEPLHDLRTVAESYRGAGLCVLPAHVREKRPTLAHWKRAQQQLPDSKDLERWFRTCPGICIVTGQVSGNLEILDFDAEGELFWTWHARVETQNKELADRLVIERSPSGGFHVAYRCEEPVCGSMKLAQRKQVVRDGSPVMISGKQYKPRFHDGEWSVLLTLIETRGEGGLFLCHPTPGYELQQKQFTAIPTLTSDERELLLQTAWELNEYYQQPDPAPVSTEAPSGRPGDDFNERGDVAALLQKHGWTLVRGGANEYWRRPGKTENWSATLKDRVLYVFSSNAAPFEPGTPYSPFAVYARLEHAADFTAAASALRAEGYGGPIVEPTDVNLSGILMKLSPLQPELILASEMPAGLPAPVGKSKPTLVSSLIVRRVSDVPRSKLEWLWPGRIPLGKLTLLAGDPGLGKSMVSIDIAARVSRGGSWPDSSLILQPVGTVIMFNSEDDLEDTVAPRLDAANADSRQILSVEGVEGQSGKDRYQRSFSLEVDLPHLERLLDENPDTRLVVIDPISAYCGKIDTHNNAEVRSMLAPLASLASHRRIAILAITHLTKGIGNKAIYRAMGSLAFAAAARAVWAIVADSDDRQNRLLLPVKMNLAQTPDGLSYHIVENAIGWSAEGVDMHADDAFAKEAAALDQRGKSKRSPVMQQAMDGLELALSTGSRPSKEMIEEGNEHGFDKRMLQRALRELDGKPEKSGFEGGWIWSLPTGFEPIIAATSNTTESPESILSKELLL